MSGGIPELAYWYAGAGEPQVYEADTEVLSVGDIAVILKQALLELGVEQFNSICVVVAANVQTEAAMESIIAKIREVCPNTGISFISKGESIAHYSLNQKKELRVNDVAFFDLDETGFMYNRLHTASFNGKINALVESKDCSEIINLESLTNVESEVLDERFKGLINELFEKQHISTVYLTGKGFINEEWAKDSLNMLCNKRRVFKGQSLYAIGAGYYAAWGYCTDVNDECRIVCDGRTAYETCLEVVYKEEKKEAVLIPVGKLCHEVGNVVVEGIISGEQAKLVFIRRALFGKEVIREEIELDGINVCKDRMLRLKVELKIVNGNELSVSVEDTGFGEFAKSTGVRVEKMLGRA